MTPSFPTIVGIVNTTPDSFSDGGLYLSTANAIDHAMRLIDDGADQLDIGGESTRPGSSLVSTIEEIERTEAVISGIRSRNTSIPISIDTRKSLVALHALRAGATMVNDVSAGRFDAEMFSVVAQNNVPMILMHMKGEPQTMQDSPEYTHVVADVFDFLHDRIVAAHAAGVRDVVCDVGIGFGKTVEHNLQLLRHHRDFLPLGVPMMLGISRKRFLGTICNIPDAAERDSATALMHALIVDSGASFIRVHNVRLMRQLQHLSTALFDRS